MAVVIDVAMIYSLFPANREGQAGSRAGSGISKAKCQLDHWPPSQDRHEQKCPVFNLWGYLLEGEYLQYQDERQSGYSKGPDPAIPHDGQGFFPIIPTRQTIYRIGKPIEMKGTCNYDQGRDNKYIHNGGGKDITEGISHRHEYQAEE